MQEIIICENQLTQAESLKKAVDNLNLLNTSCKIYQSSAKLLHDLPLLNAYSIFLLDVIMPEVNGIEIAKEINKILPQSCIIFFTAFLNTVTEIQDTNYCYFILKEEINQRLPIAMKKAMEIIENTSKSILVTQGNEKIVVHLDDIYYLERVKRYTYIILKNKKLKIREDFSVLIPMLSKQFHRCHNSFIINFDKVTSMKKNILLCYGRCISTNFLELFKRL